MKIDRGRKSRFRIADSCTNAPSEQSIRCHQGLYLEEPSSADFLFLHRESSTLRIGEAEPLPAELLPQGSITRKLRFLLLEIFDHVLLVSIDPASEDQQKIAAAERSSPPSLGHRIGEKWAETTDLALA